VLCLPAIISQLGLVQGEACETTAGIKQGRMDVELCIGDRRGTFDCLELTEVDYPLLGVTPWKFWSRARPEKSCCGYDELSKPYLSIL